MTHYLKGMLVLGIGLIFTSIYFLNQRNQLKAELDPIQKKKKMDLRDRMDLAALHEFEATKDPALGYVPRERLMDVYEIIRQQGLEKKRGKAAISGLTWNERGPNNIGGRTRAIIFDANDATHKTVFAGSVAGGLYKTTNIYADQPNWTPVNDTFANMAITTIAQDPSDPNIIYFGTGEGFFNFDAVRGDGIWKSTDGGDTWTQLSASGDSYSYIQKIVVDGDGNVIVGTRAYTYVDNGGIYRSTDGGASFSRVLSPYSANTEYNRIADIELAADGSTWYASNGIFNTDGIYKSTDSAKTWTRIYDADAVSEQRIELVCAPSNSAYIYALVQGSGSTIKKIMRSTNSGSTWTSCTNISWNDQCGGTTSTDFTRSQAWYNLIGVCDPNDETVLYVGGINIFRTDNSGTSWTQLSSWVGCGGYSNVHSDHHALVFKPGSSDTLINGNDGGVYRTYNALASPAQWTMVNRGYNVTQFYSSATHPDALSNYFITGAQDNGSQQFLSAGINSTNEVTGGDGAFSHIDQEDPDTQITAYTYNTIYITTDGFSSLSGYTTANTKGNIINESDYDSENKILYSSSNADTIQRWSNIGGGTPSQTSIYVANMNSRQASAILVSPFHPKTLYIGTEGGRVIKLANANGGTRTSTNLTSGLSSGRVSCIAMDPQDSTHLLVTYSNYGITSVYESTNSGSSWTSVEGDLPDMPVRWAIFSPIGGDSVLLATEVGVWTTDNLNGGSTAWEASNEGLANCRVDMLEYRPSDSLIVAATHGRGLYTSKFFSERVLVDFSASETVVYTGEEVDFYDDSYGATSWSWDFNNDGVAESTEQNPKYTFGEGGYYTVKLTINGSTSTTKSQFIQVLPNQGTPYTTADGGDMESNAWHFGGRALKYPTQLWERGAPSNHFTTSYYNGSNAWVTDLDADIQDVNAYCALYSPCFNFSASGTYTLSFVKSMQRYGTYWPFGAQVQYSIDKGATWARLGDETTGTNWYDRGPSATSINSHIFADSIAFNDSYTKESTSHDVSDLAGNSEVCFRIVFSVTDRYTSGSYNSRAGMLIDDFAIAGPSNDSLTGAGIESTVAEQTLDLGPNETKSFFSPSGKIIATIENVSSHDFGSTKVEIDNAGTGTQDFDTNTTGAKKIFDKTILITPTSNNTGADVKISMYFSEAELNGWKAKTGRYAEDVQLIKTTNSIGSSTTSQGVLPSANVIDSTFDGTNLCITSSFSNGFSGVGGGGGANGGTPPLPVTLLDFIAKRFEKEVILQWSTSSETNNSHFEIQRSVDGGEFERIGNIQGNGNSSDVLQYQYVDQDNLVLENNRLCYRLKQIDFDGAYEFSDLSCVSKDDITIDLALSPNPVSNILTLDINPWITDLYKVEIINLEGKLMYQNSNLEAQNKLDMSQLPSGVYFVSIKQSGETVKVEKIIKE